MNQYRDFDNDPVRYSYSEGEVFLSNLHASGRHYIPIVDSAIYVPNPQNASDKLVTPHFAASNIRLTQLVAILRSIEVTILVLSC